MRTNRAYTGKAALFPMDNMSTTTTETKPPLTRGQKIIRTLIALLFGFILSVLLLELLLSFDPWGFRQYRDQRILFEHIRPAPAGWTYDPGVYDLPYSKTTVTMLDDGTRLVPHTNVNADKTLVILGDSVAFGYQVSDDQTFADALARQLPDVHVINAAITAYNSANVLRQLQNYPDADYFLWLIVRNDADPEFDPPHHQPVPTFSWTALYLIYLPVVLGDHIDSYAHPLRDMNRYLREATEITADPRVLAVGFDNVLTPITPNAVSITPYPNTMMNSASDSHPNPQGHQFLADEILPLLQERFGL
jgi:lysophospholipase L1-like esterase